MPPRSRRRDGRRGARSTKPRTRPRRCCRSDPRPGCRVACRCRPRTRRSPRPRCPAAPRRSGPHRSPRRRRSAPRSSPGSAPACCGPSGSTGGRGPRRSGPARTAPVADRARSRRPPLALLREGLGGVDARRTGADDRHHEGWRFAGRGSGQWRGACSVVRHGPNLAGWRPGRGDTGRPTPATDSAGGGGLRRGLPVGGRLGRTLGPGSALGARRGWGRHRRFAAPVADGLHRLPRPRPRPPPPPLPPPPRLSREPPSGCF